MNTHPMVCLCSDDSRSASTDVTFAGAAAAWQANTALQQTAFGARDRAGFHVTLCSAPRPPLNAKSLDGNASQHHHINHSTHATFIHNDAILIDMIQHAGNVASI